MSRENWARPAELPEYAPQKKASFDFDKAKLQYLVDNAPTERERQRLLRVAQPHAAGFLTAVPSEDDGNDTILRPRNFQIAVAYRLGVPVLNEPVPCRLCKPLINLRPCHMLHKDRI